jgi:hydrogenase/urease accessory protein HupE
LAEAAHPVVHLDHLPVVLAMLIGRVGWVVILLEQAGVDNLQVMGEKGPEL